MTSRASNARHVLLTVPSVCQVGVAPELAVLTVLEAAILSAIPALLAAQPELLAAAPDVAGSSPCARSADCTIQLALELCEALHRYRLALAEDPQRDDPLPF